MRLTRKRALGVVAAATATLAVTGASLVLTPVSATETTTPTASSSATEQSYVLRAPTRLTSTLIEGQGEAVEVPMTAAQALGRAAAQPVLPEGTHDLAKVTSWLEKTRPEGYLHAKVRNGKGPRFELVFTTAPDTKVAKRIAEEMPVDVAVSYGAAATDEQFTNASGDLLQAVRDGLGDATLQVGQNNDGTAVEVAYNPAEVTHAEVVAAAKQALPTWDRKHGELPVVLTADPELELTEPAAAVAGGRLMNVLGTMSYCTTGFPAQRDANGNKGIVTARHCGGNMDYNNTDDVITAGAVATEVSGGQIDLRFYRTLSGHSTPARFYYGPTSYFGTAWYTNPAVGATVCKYGMTTGYNCGEVTAINKCRDYSNGITYCGLDIVGRKLAEPGDSGGPVFVSNIAVGITSGSGSNFMTYTRIGRVQNNLDSTVLTIG